MTISTSTLVLNSQTGVETPFNAEKLTDYLKSLSTHLDPNFIDIPSIIDKIIIGLPETLTTNELMELVSETIASMTTKHYHHSLLACNVLTKYHQKRLQSTFSKNIELLRSSHKNSNKKRLISESVYDTVMLNKGRLDSAIEHDRDFLLDYFGFKTLERSYLLKINGEIAETPQYLFMRVALGIHGNDIELALETYELMSKKYFIHASPTLFYSGTEMPSLSSCFLIAMQDDSIDGIFKTVHQTALISKSAGGVGLHVSNIRSTGSYIAGTNGTSSGLVPMLQVFNSTARYVDQGGNKRPGAFCIYLEPWHADVFQFLDLRKNHGKEEVRARDLFYALWIPDLFMEKVQKGDDWCLFSEDKCPGLTDSYGKDFVELYNKYEREKKYTKKVSAQKLWHAILVAQTETGNPFLLYKDACNNKSNQKNLGTIKSSNLCCEIVEYSDKDETAVCNLASVALPKFVKSEKFDFPLLHAITKIVVKNLNKVIDVGSYPTPEARRSNKRHRPIAVGVQGLADTFFLLGLSFGDSESRLLNIQIFETIYHAALEASVELAIKDGSYETYKGSPVSQGILQFDMWNKKPTDLWDWDSLKSKISKNGIRNSLLVALMPTASTSQILGYNECFEPITSNIYSRRVLSGEFQVVNKYLIDDLCKLGLWNKTIKDSILENNGSIQQIEGIPKTIKSMYKTVWEMSQKIVIDMSADRAPFIDQSQSLNLFIKEPTMSKLTSMHFYAWGKGLKTGMYYLRTRAASAAIKFTLDQSNNIKYVKKRSMIEPVETTSKRTRIESNDEMSTNGKSEVDDNFGIYDDDKVLECNLMEPGSCSSCSA